ncbi:MAG: CoA transferase, partial [Novosphingobium sp.]|nr:CoA transferase [Novosphingobium sp.]
MPDQPTPAPVSIPLSRWAERMLRAFESVSDAKGLAGLSGATLLGERAALGNYVITGKISAGPGSSRLYRTRDGRWFALTISRNVDRDYLRALFADAALDPFDEDAIASAAARHDCDSLLARGRTLGLAVAAVDEQPVSPAVSRIATGPLRKRKAHAPALVVDLSTIWAGPLAGNLLWLAGAKVVKVESKTRPDALRAFDLPMFARLNQGKANVVVDLADNAQRSALLRLIRRADIVIESSRVRALMHFGIDADALVREVPGLVWITISAHGARGEAASWIGMGHDCGIAGGLAAALAEVTGEPGYVGDAIADPLTG